MEAVKWSSSLYQWIHYLSQPASVESTLASTTAQHQAFVLALIFRVRHFPHTNTEKETLQTDQCCM
jgi:hypothetical protein